MKMQVAQIPPEKIIDPSIWTCPLCCDSGWLTKEDGGNGAAIRCKCKDPRGNKDRQKEIMLSIGMRFQEIQSAFGTWIEEFCPKPTWAMEWFDLISKKNIDKLHEAFGATVSNPWSLAIYGSNGTGKTKIAATLVRHLIINGTVSICWLNCKTDFDAIQMERMEYGSSLIEARARRAYLGVFDEYTTEGHRQNGDLQERTISNLIYDRHRTMRPTIFTTNLDVANPGSMDSKIGSRLSQGFMHKMEVEDDFRLWIQKKVRKEK